MGKTLSILDGVESKARGYTFRNGVPGGFESWRDAVDPSVEGSFRPYDDQKSLWDGPDGIGTWIANGGLDWVNWRLGVPEDALRAPVRQRKIGL